MSSVLVSRADVVEQVMRITGDEMGLMPFLCACPESVEARAALGRLAAHVDRHPAPRSPLALWLTGAGQPLDPGWRAEVGEAPGSLWGRLEMLRALYGTASGADPCRLGDRCRFEDPYEELCHLEAVADADIVDPV